MSVETMMTVGLSAAIFVSLLILLGILTLLTRITMFVFRPAARSSFALARRHAPAMRSGLSRSWEGVAATIVALSGRFAQWGVATSKRLATSAEELGDRAAEGVRTYVLPGVRSWLTGEDEVAPTYGPRRREVRHS